MEVITNFFSARFRFCTFAAMLLAFSSVLLTACASSGVQRSAANNVDSAYEGSNNFIHHVGDGSPDSQFSNASQTTKGIIIGGTTGAIVGGVTAGSAGILPVAAGGAVLGAILGAYVDYHSGVIDQLENRGVKVMVVGDQVTLVIPSAPIFRGRSAELRPEAYSTFNLASQFISNFATMSIKIGAYSNEMGDSKVACFLTRQQAEVVKRYLWTRLNARLLYADGYGGTKLIEANNLDWDKGANYRLEISFEKLPT